VVREMLPVSHVMVKDPGGSWSARATMMNGEGKVGTGREERYGGIMP